MNGGRKGFTWGDEVDCYTCTTSRIIHLALISSFMRFGNRAGYIQLEFGREDFNAMPI